MTRKFLAGSAIATFILWISGVGLASAALLDFEFDGNYGSSPYDYSTEGEGWKDLVDVNDDGSIYGGLEWETNWEIISDDMISSFYGSPSASDFPSGNEAVYNGAGDTPMIANASEFEGFELGTAKFLALPWEDGTYSSSATEIEVIGSLDGTQTGSVKLDPLEGGVWKSSDLTGLGIMDSFEITYDDSNGDKWWMMDDLELTPVAFESAALEIQSVPLPSAVWLMLAGIGGLFGARWLGNRRAI